MMLDPRPAIAFLTILPTGGSSLITAQRAARAQAWYPLTGLLIGALLTLCHALASQLLPPGPTAALIVAVWAGLTRFLHLDGVIDTCDGLLGGHSREQRLAIMRDPRAGSFGVVAVVLVLLTKWSAVSALSTDNVRPLLLAPVAGRLCIVVTVAAFPYARPEGLGAGFHQAARGLPLVIAAASALAISFIVSGPAGLLALAAAAGVTLLLGLWASRALGGVTGDSYGAACEFGECAALLAHLV